VSAFYLDASALVKRYLAEIGSAWIVKLSDPSAGHPITIAEITQVEVAAALAGRHRAPGGFPDVNGMELLIFWLAIVSTNINWQQRPP
jgi:hypothetical protein